MLNFKNITKTFKSDLMTQPFVALKNVSFEVPSGSMVGFLGANGAGKTTSLKIIMDFIRADSGVVEFSKDLGLNRNEVLKKIGFLPERPYFYPNLTGNEFLQFMGFRTYSKGMLQRIGFLSTILHEPEFIILDEPLSGLDPIGRKELKDVIVEVHREGKTIFFSSHIVPDIEEVCDRVIFLKDGELVYDGAVETLIKPKSMGEYVVKFKDGKKFSPSIPGLQVKSFPGELSVIQVSENDKSALIAELLKENRDIVGIDIVRPTLEEIFYNIRMN